ncbi:diguanylate cyclase domain-containing protein [Actinoplanes couchii]|uniref:GGDEF domain-containing protein n=1 Tax=Actinoplanes couchii TaxID=403638 RepID=A0ABQ3X1R2_9ACTN|nr:diguanylate cyclase [Actinoplanes couchii]MDR6316845.1 GGDEF domain-containing protein [Actinoplanes couchii]GID52452.1 hypothetical protein Aco03nite_008560 [Actinoplanes couchii]
MWLADPLRTRCLRTRFTRSARRSPTAIVVVDLNGDVDARLRAAFTQVLRRCAPPSSHQVRLSASGFALLLPEINTPDAAYEVAGRLAASLGPILLDGRLVTLAAAIGVAATPPAGLSHDALLDRATRAMQKAKSQGPDTRWAIWQDAPPAPSETGRAA